MEHRPLGRTGLAVSPLCLGAGMLGAAGEPDHRAAIGIVHRALDAGVTVIDAAGVPSGGESESIVGEALTGGRRDGVVLATDVEVALDDADHHGASRRRLLRSVEASLRRLGTDWIDLVQVRCPERLVDVEEVLGALTDLVRHGRIRAFGATTTAASQIVETQWAAQRCGLTGFSTEHPAYSLLARQIEIDVLPTCLRHGMGVLTHSPLATGWPLRACQQQGRDAPGSRRGGRFDLGSAANQRKLDAADALGSLADEAGLTLAQMSTAFLIRHPAVTSITIAASTVEHLDFQLSAAGLELSVDVLDRIDEIVPPGVTLDQDDNTACSSALSAAARRR